MDYEEARKQKLEALKKQEAEAEAKIGAIVRSLLSDEARTRLNNVRLVNTELYLKAVQAILYLQNARQLQGKVSEQDLKQLLGKMGERKEIKITRK